MMIHSRKWVLVFQTENPGETIMIVSSQVQRKDEKGRGGVNLISDASIPVLESGGFA